MGIDLTNFRTPRRNLIDATLAYHGVWRQTEICRNDRSQDRQVLNVNEHSLADALLRDCNRMFSEPGESLRDWLIRLGWLEVIHGVTVPVGAPEGCNARCSKCALYGTCEIQNGKKTR